jgi:hypothetical protein
MGVSHKLHVAFNQLGVFLSCSKWDGLSWHFTDGPRTQQKAFCRSLYHRESLSKVLAHIHSASYSYRQWGRSCRSFKSVRIARTGESQPTEGLRVSASSIAWDAECDSASGVQSAGAGSVVFPTRLHLADVKGRYNSRHATDVTSTQSRHLVADTGTCITTRRCYPGGIWRAYQFWPL